MITKLILRGYIRLMASNINEFVFTPTSSMQVILGTNGSGKSSVLSELTTVPSHRSNFIKGGYKELHCTYKGQSFILTSEYNTGTGNHHCICVETGHDFNPGGTYAVQQVVTEKLFGCDKALTDLMLGITKFTTMSVAERRQWITRLCPVDMGLAFKLYKHFGSLQRDQKGVIKSTDKRLMNSAKDELADFEVAQTEAQLKELHKHLTEIYQHKQKLAPHVNAPVTPEEWKARAKRLLLTDVPEVLKGFPSREAAGDKLQSLSDEVQHLQGQQSAVAHELENIDRELNQFQDSGEIDLTEATAAHAQLVASVNKVKAALSEQKATVLPTIPLFDRQIPSATLQEMVAALMQLLSTIPTNETGYFSQDRAKANLQEHAKLNGDITSLKNETTVLERRILSIKHAQDCECPSCHFTFKPGIDPTEHKRLSDRIDNNNEQVEQLTARLEKVKEYGKEVDEYRDYVNSYRNLVRQYQWANELWDYLTSNKIVFRVPRSVLSDLLVWSETMLLQLQHDELTHEISRYEVRIALAKKTDSKALAQRKERKAYLEEHLYKINQSISSLSQERDTLRKAIATTISFEQELNEVQRLFTDGIVKDLAHEIQVGFQAGLDEEVRLDQVRISALDNKLQEHMLKTGAKRALEDQRHDAVELERQYGVLTQSLNPTDGLIGRYLKNSMGGIVKRLNAIIDCVWTYPLLVIDSPLEKEELTYRFPLDVMDGTITPQDISLGSSSQRDIVDFAFKITVMGCLGRTDIPLYMDEVGASFDEAHRAKLVDMIDTMLENQKIEQVFLVSHYNSNHGIFTHAQFAVLDDKNITVPKTYNQHVEIS